MKQFLLTLTVAFALISAFALVQGELIDKVLMTQERTLRAMTYPIYIILLLLSYMWLVSHGVNKLTSLISAGCNQRFCVIDLYESRNKWHFPMRRWKPHFWCKCHCYVGLFVEIVFNLGIVKNVLLLHFCSHIHTHILHYNSWYISTLFFIRLMFISQVSFKFILWVVVILSIFL